MNGPDQRGELVLRDRSARPGLDVNHPKAGLDLDDRRLRAVLRACVDVALDPGPRQRALASARTYTFIPPPSPVPG